MNQYTECKYQLIDNFKNEKIDKKEFEKLYMYNEKTLEKYMSNIYLYTIGNDQSKIYDEYISFLRFKTTAISKNYVNNYIYLKFIKEDGYNTKKYWSKLGWKFIKENDIECPLYWEFGITDNTYYIKDIYTKNIYDIECVYNEPVYHISYYEAEAFCKWYACKIPTLFELDLFYAHNKFKMISEWEWCNSKHSNMCRLQIYSKNMELKYNDEDRIFRKTFRVVHSI